MASRAAPVAGDSRQSGLPAGLGQVGPAIIVGVEADLGRPYGLVGEEVVEQRMQSEIEGSDRYRPRVRGERLKLHAPDRSRAPAM